MIITAVYLFNNYADYRGLISEKILEQFGWSIEKAESEGLVVKERYKLNKYIVTSEAKHKTGGKYEKHKHN